MLGDEETEETNLRVVCRFRPYNKRELDLGTDDSADLFTFNKHNSVTVHSKNSESFKLTRIFRDVTQDEMYRRCAAPVMSEFFKGFNATIFAYGQTGTGKSFTMLGDLMQPELRGIIPRCVNQIFDVISRDSQTTFTISSSYCEIYQEKVTDLLDLKKKDLAIRESKERGVYVEGLTREYVTSEADIYQLIRIADIHKKKCSTKMNPESSRSHCCFTLWLSTKTADSADTTEASLNLVDLAGSERVGKTNATGRALKEAQKINLSLTCLSKCIHALAAGQPTVPYRESKLTRLLQNSLGGNSKTSMVVACSPHKDNLEETLSTLRFAKRCITVTTEATRNLKLNSEELANMLRAVEAEIRRVETSDEDVVRVDVSTQTDPAPIGTMPIQRLMGELASKRQNLEELNGKVHAEQQMLESLTKEMRSIEAEIQSMQSKSGEPVRPRHLSSTSGRSQSDLISMATKRAVAASGSIKSLSPTSGKHKSGHYDAIPFTPRSLARQQTQQAPTDGQRLTRAEIIEAQKKRKKAVKHDIRDACRDLGKLQMLNADDELLCDDQNDVISRQQDIISEQELEIAAKEDQALDLEETIETLRRNLAELQLTLAKSEAEETQAGHNGNLAKVLNAESVLSRTKSGSFGEEKPAPNPEQPGFLGGLFSWRPNNQEPREQQQVGVFGGLFGRRQTLTVAATTGRKEQ